MADKEERQKKGLPPVTRNRMGVISVSPADIVRSEVGRAQLEKILNSRMYQNIERERTPKKSNPGTL
jgi:hypothetical protein